MKKVVVVLKLSRLTVPQKVEKGRFIVTSMTGNEFFLSPSPTLNVVTLAVSKLETAAIKAKGGGKDETAAMRAAEFELDKVLTSLGFYVETTANNFTITAEQVVLSAGMDVKRPSIHPAREFAVKNTKLPGEVLMRTKSINRASYIWAYTETPENENSWKQAAISVKASFKLDGLSSGVRYSFRVAVVTKNGQGPWSNVIQLIVM